MSEREPTVGGSAVSEEMRAALTRQRPQCARCGEYEQLGTMHICPDMRATCIRTGDTVLHRPSGERWVVAYVAGNYLAWCGWPAGEARLSDCELVESCTDATHWEWVGRVAKSADGKRARMCQAMLDERPAAFIEQDIADQRRPCPHCGAPMEASVPARDDKEDTRLTDAMLADLTAIAEKATQDEWKVGHSNTQTLDEACAWMSATLSKRDSADLWMVFIGDAAAENGVITPAHTGNGPTSKANAEYLCAVQPTNILYLVSEFKRARNEIKRARNEIERLTRLLERR